MNQASVQSLLEKTEHLLPDATQAERQALQELRSACFKLLEALQRRDTMGLCRHCGPTLVPVLAGYCKHCVPKE